MEPNKQFECKPCKQFFTRMSSLYRHEETFEHKLKTGTAELLECRFCKKTFRNPDDYEHHLTNYLCSSADERTCDWCGLELSSKSKLILHNMNKHHKKKVQGLNGLSFKKIIMNENLFMHLTEKKRQQDLEEYRQQEETSSDSSSESEDEEDEETYEHIVINGKHYKRHPFYKTKHGKVSKLEYFSGKLLHPATLKPVAVARWMPDIEIYKIIPIIN